MANEEHLAIIKQGVGVWNQWRKENPDTQVILNNANLSKANLYAAELRDVNLVGADLSGADLRNAKLNRANLLEANLSKADLFRAHLNKTKLSGADLSGAYLNGTRLRGADLSYVDLSRAKVHRADLSGAYLNATLFIAADLSNSDFSGARVIGTDFTDSYMKGTSFGAVDLRPAKGLENVNHGGPSYLDIHTIYQSDGTIPESFLKGVGLPDNFITYARSLAGKAIDYYSVFISYSGKDNDFAKRLYADLQDDGVRCWFAPEKMEIGDRFLFKIDESIQRYDKLLLVLSENSVMSRWVKHEVMEALEKEAYEDRLVLVPIRLDGAVMNTNEGWAAKIKKTRHIGNFTDWRDLGSYHVALKRLLRDLKVEE